MSGRVTTKEYRLDLISKELSKVLDGLNFLTLTSKEDLSAETKNLLLKAISTSQDALCEFLTKYEAETGEYVNFMEGWSFRSEWEGEIDK